MVKFCPIMKCPCIGTKCIAVKKGVHTWTNEDCTGNETYHSNDYWYCTKIEDVTFLCKDRVRDDGIKCEECMCYWCASHPTNEPSVGKK